MTPTVGTFRVPLGQNDRCKERLALKYITNTRHFHCCPRQQQMREKKNLYLAEKDIFGIIIDMSQMSIRLQVA